MAEDPAKPRTLATLLLLIAIALAAGLATLYWLDARSRIGATQEELARRLRDIENDAREAQVKVLQLESRLAESQSQQLALEALYQEMSRNRDEWQLAEARLAKADRPQFLPVRRALARDIERLKALPVLDIAAMSSRIDTLVAGVDSLPLAFEEKSVAVKNETKDSERGFWSRLGSEVWGEVKQLVVVRQVGFNEPPLLPPPQAYFLRENLRLRLLNARLSLLARDEAGYREDLRAAQGWIKRYFDPRSKQTVDAQTQLKQLSSTSISFEMPTISESLDAVRGFKSRRTRSPG